MLWTKVKSFVPVLENRYFLLEIFDTERCRESVLEYLVIYLKDGDSMLTKRAEKELLELVAVLSSTSVRVLAVML